MDAELAEKLDRYRRKFIHLVRPSTLPWQVALDAETYFGQADALRQTPEVLIRPDVFVGGPRLQPT